MSIHPAVIDRFIDKIEVGETSCWLWGGAGKGAYGVFMPDARRDGPRRLVKVHRFSYELFVGPIPKGHVIDHLCKIPSCVNPSHLEPVLHSENIRRGFDQTQCINGHPRNEENTYYRPSTGQRECRACNREKHRKPTGVAPAIETKTNV